ncbi:hypothetical protein DLAC_05978 [Tieghemostelium lacteum]|uniref:Uncharacterized protein n=1 Tax=Tieghemostelium lacteum TaxID=361077 RepID=A0A151ZH55_TIELA|nr:hypothetical protein DLAC_05978 [Tieghemostelium lacteum]|eukprot:KYQ93311.1 hypothetical protein DLAC_05978 [Tieghemostelium lacteum]
MSGNNTHRRIGNAGRSKSTVSLFQIQFNSQKTLKTAQQKPYGVPSKSIEEWNSKLKSKDTTGIPVFLGVDGTFYDINYVPVFKHKTPEKQSTLTNGNSPRMDGNNTLEEEEDDEIEETFEQQLAHLYNSIPQIDEYENFFDYEQAFLGWKFAVETIFQDTRLPNTTGRAYYRPKHVDFQNKIRETSTFQEDFSRPSVSSFSNEGDSDEQKTDPNQSEIEEDQMGIDINLIENSQEPWDALVVPQEPQPMDYDTFEDYDEALCRWASICSQLPIFPPHATQLRDLIPIQSVSESQLSNQDQNHDDKKHADKDGMQSSIPNILIKSGIAEYQFLNNSLPDRYKPKPLPKEEHVFELIRKDQLPVVPENTRRVISAIFSTIEQRRQAHFHQAKSYLPTMISKLHGTLPLPLLSNQKSTAMSFKNDHLRRTDLTPKQITDNYDCPVKISGVPVQFKVPDHDLHFELHKLYNDPGYPSILMNQLKTFHTSDRHDHLYSWYHPLVNEEHQKHKEEIDFIIMTQHRSTKDKLNIQNISDILYGDMYLDKFSDLLDASFSEDFDGGKSYATVITKCITPDNIHELLGLLEYSQSPLFQAKMSHLIMHFFSGNKGSLILEKLIQNKDVKNLSLLTSSFDYISDVPADLMPWSDETYSLVKLVLGDSNENLWKLIFCNYYLSVIGRVLDTHVHLYYSKPVITQSKVSLTHSIATLLQNNTPSILDKIFTGIRHRSITVSSFCLFILLQLMHNQEGLAISNCLKADGIFLLDRIKCVCESKLKHVQFAARRLFSVISKSPWVDFVYKEFNKDPDSSIKDFVGSDEKKPSSLLLELTLEFFVSSLDRALEAAIASVPITNTSNIPGQSGQPTSTTPPLSPVGSPQQNNNASAGVGAGSAGSNPNQPTITIGIKNKFSFVLDNFLFHNLYQYFVKHSKEASHQMYVITNLLNKLAKTHGTLNNIQANTDLKSVKKWGESKLSISASDVRSMISKISDPSPSNNPYTPLIKKNLLEMVRHLLKQPPVFENIKKEEDFYSKLQSFCKDGSFAELNRESWCLLYQITRNHIGTMDTLIKDKILHGFLELVGIGTHTTVIINGLHYISKMFSIPMTVPPVGADTKLIQKYKNDNKIIEKDIKSLNQLFIEKIWFIKIHMIYKRYISTQPGLAFIELANFYHILNTNENCKKLHKDTVKKPEYKEGLLKIANMFKSDPQSDQNADGTMKPLTKEPSFLQSLSNYTSGSKDKSDKDKSNNTNNTGSGSFSGSSTPNSPSTSSSGSTSSSFKSKFGGFLNKK